MPKLLDTPFHNMGKDMTPMHYNSIINLGLFIWAELKQNMLVFFLQTPLKTKIKAVTFTDTLCIILKIIFSL